MGSDLPQIVNATSLVVPLLFAWPDNTNCKAQQQTRNAARNETDPDKVLKNLWASGWPVCARHNPEQQSDDSVDEYPKGMSILAEHEKEHDLNDSFSNENYADYEGQKNNPKQRICQQIDCSKAVKRGYECVPAKGAASEMNPEHEMRDAREDKQPT